MSIYTRFSPDDIVEANPTVVTTGIWSGDAGALKKVFLNEDQYESDTSGIYYFDVYQTSSTEVSAEIQFAVTYGHVNGGGAATLLDNEQSKLPTKAIYSQYRSLLLDPSDTLFTFNASESEHVYVINLQRARIREQLDPGNWILPLSGTNGIFNFIDDSGQTLGALTANSKSGRVFNVVSGSLTGISGSTIAATNSPDGKGFGLVYPDLGIIVLNPDAICPMVGFATTGSVSGSNITGSSYGVSGSTDWAFTASPAPGPAYLVTNVSSDLSRPLAPVTSSVFAYDDTPGNEEWTAYNYAGLYHSLRLALNDSSGEVEFRARSAETISSTHYFVRLRNKEYNYSNNPTFYNLDTGVLTFSDFRNDPKVYITTVGLYNQENELLAVAKLSKPVQKSFDEELLLRVRLDF
jgi:hypothetical protein